MKLTHEQAIELHGFNNLTKSLSFNMYDICFTRTREEREAYLKYIDEQYSAERLQKILTHVSDIIGAHVLNVASQDFEPAGASVTLLVSEGPVANAPSESFEESPGPLPESVVIQLDKSHITVHTYPEFHPDEGISTFRADIDVSTCGEISPLKALHYLIRSFETDVMTIDYRVRGFTRDKIGHKLFIDHEINSIQNYIPEDVGELFDMIDVNVYHEHIEITERLKIEMDEIFYGKNIV
jgi:S-adenosylmethionine decarboxylase